MPVDDLNDLESIHQSMASALSPPKSDEEVQREEEIYSHPLLAPFGTAGDGSSLAEIPADLLEESENPTPSPALDAR